MKERPILFSAPMVLAILSGQKTQTRRVVKGAALEWLRPGMFTPEAVANPDNFLCPYGQPGDRLWVREAWSADFANYYPHDRCWYRASDERKHDIEVRDGVRGIFSPESNEFVPFRWRPSIHMPRWACRLVLEIVSVRVERLNDISSADALAEGVSCHPDHHNKPRESIYSPVGGFRELWESINGPESWGANTWIWVLEFKIIDPAEAQ